MKCLLTAAAAAGWLGIAAAPALAEEAIDVVATVGMIGDVAKNVAGDCAEVTSIMGPGVDPHLYQARAADVRAFETTEIILYSGYFLEGQLGAVLAKFGERKPTVALSESSIPEAELIKVQGAYGVDPHLWMDAGLWSRLAPTIATTLGELRPACAEEFATNAEAYVAQLTALDAWAREAIGTIPESQRSLVTAHDAFGYYGRAYGIEVAGLQGLTTQSEASIADIRATAALVAETGVPAVFIESTINPRMVQAVIDAVRQRGNTVEIGGSLYSDAMGEEGTAGGTYIGMIFANTRTITEALGGTVPPLPEALAGWAEQWGVSMAAAE